MPRRRPTARIPERRYAELEPPVRAEYSEYSSYLRDFENYCRFIDRRPEVSPCPPDTQHSLHREILSDITENSSPNPGNAPRRDGGDDLSRDQGATIAPDDRTTPPTGGVTVQKDSPFQGDAPPAQPTYAEALSRPPSPRGRTPSPKPRSPLRAPSPRLPSPSRAVNPEYLGLVAKDFDRTYRSHDRPPYRVIVAALAPLVSTKFLAKLTREDRLPKSFSALLRLQKQAKREHAKMGRNGILLDSLSGAYA